MSDITIAKAFGAPTAGSTQKIAYTGTAGAVNVDANSMYKLTATTNCYVVFTAGGSASADSDEDYLVADTAYWYGTDSSLTRVSAVQASAAGTLHVTKLTERSG